MMLRRKPLLLVSEAGGTLTRNFVDSLNFCKDKYNFVGISSNPYELELAGLRHSYLVPKATDLKFIPFLKTIIKKHRPDFFHSQHDLVIKVISEYRDELGVKVFLPSKETIKNCVNKFSSNRIWSDAGLRVPKAMLISSNDDLRRAFEQLGRPLWIRANEGGGGYGALRTESHDFARYWIDFFNGWRKFSASEYIGENSVTWSSIWYNGELIVAQGRKRLKWLFADRTLSGVTGITGVGITYSNRKMDGDAIKAIKAIDKMPHGIFSVDFTLDKDENRFLTEINIGRFFTTHNFFAHAGLNLAQIYVDLALKGKKPSLNKPINPLPDNLVWIRGMDTAPRLVHASKILKKQNDFTKIYRALK